MKSYRIYNIPFWGMCISLILGAFMFSLEAPSIKYFFVSILFLLSVLMVMLKQKNSTVFIIISCVVFCLIGGLRYQLAIPENQSNHIIHQTNLGAPVKTIFTVTKGFKKANKWENYKASIKQIEGNSTTGSILLKVNSEDTSTLQIGATYIGYLRLNKLVNETFPYGFRYGDYLKNKGITHQVWASKSGLKLLPNQSNILVQFIANLQIDFNTALRKQRLDATVIQFTQALVLGNKKELDKSVSADFKNAGVIHILAISGLHIGIIYLVFLWFFKLLFYQYKYRFLRSFAVVLLLWMFAWFSGASDSALRATTMVTCFEISRLLLRSQHPLNALFLSVFVLFFITPQIIFSVGFQLSVVAVASIIIGVPKMLKLWEPKWWLLKYLWGITCVSMCAQLGLLPLSIYYFHQFPLLFLVANIPIMFCIPIIMAFAISIVIGSYASIFPDFVYAVYNLVITKLILFVNWVASFDALILNELYISKFSVACIYLFFLYLRWCYADFKRGIKYVLFPVVFMGLVGFVEVTTKAFKREVWLLNDYKKTIIIDVSSSSVQVFSSEVLSAIDKEYKMRPILGKLHQSNVVYSTLEQAYFMNKQKLLIVANNYIPKPKTAIDILLISNSPKINFERLLEEIQPKKVIFAANNKYYLLVDWKFNCRKLTIPFYDIAESGSLRLDEL